jgi:hypothetical protein
MRRFLTSLCLAFLLPAAASASTFITATVALTNTIFGTSNYMTLTVNGNTRTFTNTVFVPATQILTNSTQSGSAANLLNHIAANPFSGVGLGQTATTNIVLKSADTALTVTVSTGWAVVSYVTNVFGGTNISVTVSDNYTATVKTNVYSGIAAMINSAYNTNPITKGVATTNPVFYGLLTVTNPATGNKVTITNGAITVTSSGTNLIGLSTFTNAHNGHFLFQGADGLVTNSDNAAPLTNLTILSSLDIPDANLFTNNLSGNATISWGNFDWMTNGGRAVILAHTNGTIAVTNIVRFRQELPWDWNSGTVKVGLQAVCSGTNSLVATNWVAAVRAASIVYGSDMGNPTWSTLVRLTNNIPIGAWTNSPEGITAAFAVGGTASPTNGIIWEIQRHGGDAGDTETNGNFFIWKIRVYFQRNTLTNYPASTP